MLPKADSGEKQPRPPWLSASPPGDEGALLQLARRAFAERGICEAVPKVVVNGEATALPQGATVTDLLQTLNLAATDVAVERNAEIVPRATFANATLEEGDALQIVTFVGGG